MTLRIVLGEDNLLVREGVRRMLSADAGFEVVGASGDLDGLIEVIDKFEPDVVLTDIRMPPDHQDEGVRAANYCRKAYPKMGVIMLSQYVEPGYVRVLLAQGTERRGYLLKERVADADDLHRAIRSVAEGGSALDPRVIETLVANRATTGDLSRLTRRETEVLAAMAEGHTNAAIGGRLFLSTKAVEKHINSIFSKLGLGGDQATHPRVRAVLLYLSEGARAT